jgi:hypothetical protein
LRALFWPLFPRSVLAQPATVVAGTTSESAALASGRLIRRGSQPATVAALTTVGALLWPLVSVDVGSDSPCDGVPDR